MAWQPEVGSGSDRATNTQDFLTKLVQMACSQHVATVAINAAGTSYTVGDELTLTHASAHLDARFEVTSVGGSGEVTGLRIIASGAFAQQATSATVTTGGTGYAVGDIIQVQGGTSRLPAKFEVATLSGSAVATVDLFEGGGVYSATPSNPAATEGVGPDTFAGNDAATLTVSYQAIIGTTGLTVTGGTGSSATVDITLAESGWTVDGRDRNDWADDDAANGDEKQVTLVGDASGSTNKPYVHLATGRTVSGLDTRHWVEVWMSLAHNASLDIDGQPGKSPDYVSDGGCFLLFPSNASGDADFWLSIDDQRILAIVNENPTATTDDGRYQQLYAGYMDRMATESEDPYPAMVFASSRNRDVDPSTQNDDITSLAEMRATSDGPGYYYRSEAGAWTQIKNNDTLSITDEDDVMFPFGSHQLESSSSSAETIVKGGPILLNSDAIKRDRSSSGQTIRPCPGTTDEYFLFPLCVVRQHGTTADDTTDGPRGVLRGAHFVYNDDGSGSAINNFSEDYITIGTDRYRVFHNHVNTERYQFTAVKEDV